MQKAHHIQNLILKHKFSVLAKTETNQRCNGWSHRESWISPISPRPRVICAWEISSDVFSNERKVFEDLWFINPIALMHVTSWSESYPLRNSLMGVRGFRQVVVQSFYLSAFVLKRPALLALERQSQEMRFFSSPKTTSVGRLFEGETQALIEVVTLACR